VAGILTTLVAIGVVGGSVIGWRSPVSARPGFRFLREDFFEFCGFVALLAAFPTVIAVGINGAADWVGRLAFQLAFLGSWALLPMCASAYGIGQLTRIDAVRAFSASTRRRKAPSLRRPSNER
jgi:hypothetical protein